MELKGGNKQKKHIGEKSFTKRKEEATKNRKKYQTNEDM